MYTCRISQLHQNILTSAPSPSATPERRPRALFLCLAYFSLPSLLLFTSLFLHTTSFSPIRISGHILCSFSQVSGLYHCHAACSETDVAAALESLPVLHIAKFDIYGSVSVSSPSAVLSLCGSYPTSSPTPCDNPASSPSPITTPATAIAPWRPRIKANFSPQSNVLLYISISPHPQPALSVYGISAPTSSPRPAPVPAPGFPVSDHPSGCHSSPSQRQPRPHDDVQPPPELRAAQRRLQGTQHAQLQRRPGSWSKPVPSSRSAHVPQR